MDNIALCNINEVKSISCTMDTQLIIYFIDGRPELFVESGEIFIESGILYEQI